MIPVVPEHVREAGSAIAAQLFDASVQATLGGMGGCKQFDITNFPEENHELILAYVKHEITSVEAIYLCMDRARGEMG
jgi:hypothetical protein